MLKAWKIVTSDKAAAEINLLVKNGSLTREDQEVIRAWAREIVTYGVGHIVNSEKWNDHALDGNWRGYRSSSFSYSGRIIYKIIENKIVVEVVRVTTMHDYKKGGNDG